MKKNQQVQSFFLLQILVYAISLVLFVGLLATVGINLLLSHIFLSSFTEVSYIQTFAKMNGVLFSCAIVILFLFTALCSTFFRWVQLLSLTKKPVSPVLLFTKFLRVFVYQWGFFIALVVLSWVGGELVMRHLSPVVRQESLYDNRAEYYEKVTPLEFVPEGRIKES
ncbi:MAG: hypothetical protein KBD46_03635 [Candidatus Levybacteria bacterium]|nr:hypothetical protein [Candidatus Levybacteria bacterium]